MGYGWHAYATDEQHAVPRRILHAYHATATEILHSSPDACSTKMDCTADHPQTWPACHADAASPDAWTTSRRSQTWHAHCQTSTAHATADGWSSCARSTWSSTSTASCDDPGSGAADCYYVGCCSYARAEADVGREVVSSDPQDAPRSGG